MWIIHRIAHFSQRKVKREEQDGIFCWFKIPLNRRNSHYLIQYSIQYSNIQYSIQLFESSVTFLILYYRYKMMQALKAENFYLYSLNLKEYEATHCKCSWERKKSSKLAPMWGKHFKQELKSYDGFYRKLSALIEFLSLSWK